MKNILTFDELFSWVRWGAEEIKRSTAEVEDRYLSAVERIKSLPTAERDFKNVLAALESASAALGDALQKVYLLANVSPEIETRDAARVAEEGLRNVSLRVMYDEQLYLVVKDVAEKKEDLEYDEAKLLGDTLKSYRRLGFDLPREERAKLLANKKQLISLESSFAKNINNHHDEIKFPPHRATGLPAELLARLIRSESGDYIVSLAYPEFVPFMENALDSELRKELADKNYLKGGVQNLELLRAILILRAENAALLGYPTHAHYVIDDRMAESPERASEFLEGLRARLSARADAELDELIAMKRELRLGSAGDQYDYELKYYDSAYVAKQLEMRRYAFDKEEVRKYFPFERVLTGVMEIYEKVLGVCFHKMENAPTWHSDAELYVVSNVNSEVPLGYFYLDLYPRPKEGKFSHAAAFTAIAGRREESFNVLPVSAMVANFTKPTKERPSLLSHGEVETFFHEFGHLMHILLTKARFASQAGTNVKWDFVELPSQMFQEWVWDRAMLKRLSGHFETGDPLPDELIDKMLAGKNFLAARGKLRQYTLAHFDLALHMGDPERNAAKFYNELVHEHLKMELPESAIFPAGFGHLMGYDAGYYSYLWAEVFAHDCFGRFKREGLLSAATGADFRKNILEVGSSREEAESLRQFLGRDPNDDAFFEELGLNPTQ